MGTLPDRCSWLVLFFRTCDRPDICFVAISAAVSTCCSHVR